MDRMHAMIVYEPPASMPVSRSARFRRRELAAFLTQAREAMGLDGEVNVLLAGDSKIRALNRRFRKKNKATDVLSFPAAMAGGPLAGDLAISVETALRQAKALEHSLEEELKILLLHGLLHLAGYDHETDAGEMRGLESRLRRRFGLPIALIERATANEPVPKTGRKAVAKAAGRCVRQIAGTS
jgi:probable rRNA maturation factor